jgi:hypothetical protein
MLMPPGTEACSHHTDSRDIMNTRGNKLLIYPRISRMTCFFGTEGVHRQIS